LRHIVLLLLKEEQMKKIRIKQTRSGIGKPERQKRTLRALGLRKMHQTVEHNATPQILGMVEKIKHLVVIEEI
jgi:large subunit ribosomal protein L30